MSNKIKIGKKKPTFGFSIGIIDEKKMIEECGSFENFIAPLLKEAGIPKKCITQIRKQRVYAFGTGQSMAILCYQNEDEDFLRGGVRLDRTDVDTADKVYNQHNALYKRKCPLIIKDDPIFGTPTFDYRNTKPLLQEITNFEILCRA